MREMITTISEKILNYNCRLFRIGNNDCKNDNTRDNARSSHDKTKDNMFQQNITSSSDCEQNSNHTRYLNHHYRQYEYIKSSDKQYIQCYQEVDYNDDLHNQHVLCTNKHRHYHLKRNNVDSRPQNNLNRNQQTHFWFNGGKTVDSETLKLCALKPTYRDCKKESFWSRATWRSKKSTESTLSKREKCEKKPTPSKPEPEPTEASKDIKVDESVQLMHPDWRWIPHVPLYGWTPNHEANIRKLHQQMTEGFRTSMYYKSNEDYEEDVKKYDSLDKSAEFLKKPTVSTLEEVFALIKKTIQNDSRYMNPEESESQSSEPAQSEDNGYEADVEELIV